MLIPRLFGAILLIAGTTIGAGMLALPVMTGIAGFFPSLLLLLALFFFLLLTAFYLLEVNLKMPKGSNFISMVDKTLHRPGEVVAWVTYLLLLYALTAAYLVGATQIFSDFVEPFLGKIPPHLGPLLIFFLFGAILYFGTEGADMMNRILMIGLFGSYLVLFGVGIFHIDPSLLTNQRWGCLASSAPIIVTSFGYHIVIPTLTEYLHRDVKAIKKAIVIGSVIPLIIYISWQILVLGVIPVEGECSLMSAQKLGMQATLYLKKIIGNPIITTGATFFAFFAIITSLLGVTLSLSDFLADGLKITKKGMGKLLLILFTFLPPLFFATFFPKGFILALNYAGIFVVVLLAILPTLMALKLRQQNKEKGFHVFGGKPLLYTMIFLSFFLLFMEVIV